MTIVEFLLARIAEDEAEGQQALKDWPTPDYNGVGDPDRWLAECAAKRAVVEQARDYIPELEYGDNGEWAFDVTLRAMAAVYADHPHYDQAWRS